MKKSTSALLAIGLFFAMTAIAMAGSVPGSGIKATFHDLSATGVGGAAIGQTTETRICVFCHTPHFAAKQGSDVDTGATSTINAQINYYPLWNHDLTTIATYQTYTDGTGGMTNNLSSDLGQPGGVSRLCLSCHDGSVAINAYGHFQNNPSPGAGAPISMTSFPGYLIGGNGDLRNHHPVGVNYVPGDGTGGTYALFDTTSDLINSSMGLKISDVLRNGKVECASCHSVHNKGNDGAKFLWVEDSNQSDLCLSCHDK